jgi:hypothetical protein
LETAGQQLQEENDRLRNGLENIERELTETATALVEEREERRL